MVFLCLTAVGQRMPFFTHHVTNPYLYNPAFAGYDAHPVLYLTHRQQWAGVDGAPVSTHLSFHTPAGNANPVSLGADLTHDRIGIFRYSSFRTSAAYMLPLSAEKEHYLRFGLSIGLGLDAYDLGGVNASDDALFQAAQNAGIFFDGRFGLQYHFENFNLGVSLPELFTPPSLGDDGSSGGFDKFSRAIGSLNYRFRLHPEGKFSIEPTILYHHAEAFEPQIEALALFRFGESFWVGGGYLQQAGIASLIGFRTKSLSFGYHYGLAGNALASNSFGTHEIQLGLILGKKKAMVKRKPRLTTKADTEAIPQAVIEARKKLEKAKEKEKKKEHEAPPARKQATQAPTTSPSGKPATSPAERNTPSYESYSFEEIDPNATKQTITLGEAPESSNEPSEPRFAKAKRTESNHPLEMKEGVYLIVGTFSQRANAEKLARQLTPEGYPAAVGYNSDKQYYYVSLMQAADSDAVRSKIHQVRNDPRFGKAWILIIE